MWSRATLVALGVMLTGAAVGVDGEAAPVTVVEHVGAEIPRDLQFTDESGRSVSLGAFLDGKPLVISMAYFSCPMLCPVGQAAAAEAFRASGWTLGRDFSAVTVSIDPTDGPDTANGWRERAAASLGRRSSELSWHYLVDRHDAASRLARAVGYQYSYDPVSRQYAHPAALVVVGKDGRVSRYLYGISFTGKELSDALSDAGDNRHVGSMSTFILRCFHYIPAARAHGTFVVWLLRGCGVLVSVSIAAALLVLWRREPV